MHSILTILLGLAHSYVFINAQDVLPVVTMPLFFGDITILKLFFIFLKRADNEYFPCRIFIFLFPVIFSLFFKSSSSSSAHHPEKQISLQRGC